MKNDVMMPSIVQMDAEELQKLMTEVKETVATGVQLPKKVKQRSFGELDLWNIRRNAKSATSMIRRY